MRLIIKNCRNCDKPHEFEFDRPFLKELRFLDRTYGLTAEDFQEGLNQEGTHVALEATAALLDMLHRREGVVIPQLEIDLDFEDFDVIPDAVEEAEAEAEAGKDDGAVTPPS